MLTKLCYINVHTLAQTNENQHRKHPHIAGRSSDKRLTSRLFENWISICILCYRQVYETTLTAERGDRRGMGMGMEVGVSFFLEISFYRLYPAGWSDILIVRWSDIRLVRYLDFTLVRYPAGQISWLYAGQISLLYAGQISGWSDILIVRWSDILIVRWSDILIVCWSDIRLVRYLDCTR